MADPEEVARIRAYLGQYRGTYSQAGLRRKLLADGHDPRTVEIAMAQVYKGRAWRATLLDRALQDSPLATVAFAGTFLADLGGISLLIRRTSSLSQMAVVAGSAVALELSLALMCWFSPGYRPLARGILTALATLGGILVIMGALVALLFGTCLLILKGLGFCGADRCRPAIGGHQPNFSLFSAQLWMALRAPALQET
jgi:hypothetical protein